MRASRGSCPFYCKELSTSQSDAQRYELIVPDVSDVGLAFPTHRMRRMIADNRCAVVNRATGLSLNADAREPAQWRAHVDAQRLAARLRPHREELAIAVGHERAEAMLRPPRPREPARRQHVRP